MPYSDAVQYFHGSSTSSGPLTSTVKALTSVSQSGTTLTYTAGSGIQLLVGDSVVLAGGGYTTQTVVILAFLTGAGLSGTATVNVSQTVTSTTATAYPPLIGDGIGQALGASGSGYCNLELDFGAPNTGGSYPWIPAFPSLTEKGYTNPAEVVGNTGAELGVHIIVMAPFNTANSFSGFTFDVCTSAAASATYNGTPGTIASRALTQAQLAVQGAHYFIPVPQSAVLEFLRWYAIVGTGNPTAGTLVSYWGPRTGGEQ